MYGSATASDSSSTMNVDIVRLFMVVILTVTTVFTPQGWATVPAVLFVATPPTLSEIHRGLAALLVGRAIWNNPTVPDVIAASAAVACM